MAHKAPTRAKVRTGYVTGLSLEEAAEAAEVPPSTARAWKSAAKRGGDDWDAARAAHFQSRGGVETVRAILEMMLRQTHRTFQELDRDAQTAPDKRVAMLASLSDSLAKTTSSLAKIDTQAADLAMAQRILGFLSEFVERRFPGHVPVLLEILDPLAEELVAWLDK